MPSPHLFKEIVGLGGLAYFFTRIGLFGQDLLDLTVDQPDNVVHRNFILVSQTKIISGQQQRFTFYSIRPAAVYVNTIRRS